MDADFTVPIPADIAALDAAWLQQALAVNHPAVEVAHVRVQNVIAGCSTKIRMAVDYAAGGEAGLPPTMIVKGGFADHSHLFWSMHETEFNFYANVASRSRLNTPRCFFAGIDRASGRSLVIIEDLDARGGTGVRWLNAKRPLNFQDEAVFVDALAAFAAEWWESAEFAPGGTLAWAESAYEGEAGAYVARYLQPENWQRFMVMPRCTCLPRSLLDRGQMQAALAMLQTLMGCQSVTLAHGDAHLGNLFLDHEGRPGFFDGQPRRAGWAKDFSYQMVAALDIEDRRRWEKPLLARYLRKLAEAGVANPPSFTEAWHNYQCEIAWGLFIFMINENTFQFEEINTAYAARFGAAAIDHQTFALLR